MTKEEAGRQIDQLLGHTPMTPAKGKPAAPESLKPFPGRALRDAPGEAPQLQQLADFTLAARALQQELVDQGFYRGKIDGAWGPMSQAALAAWRAKHSRE